MPSLHEGHRRRLKERFLKDGLDGFEDHNVLELLLFYAIPQRDTNELAHQLLKRFGSLSGVFNANYQELCQENGVGANVATLLKMVPELARRYLDDQVSAQTVLTTMEQIGDFLRPKFVGRQEEMVYLLCLSNKGGVVGGGFLSKGVVNATVLSAREVVELALRNNASAVVLAHNHPHGLALPSSADIAVTKELQNALEMVKIEFMDHLIFSDDAFISLRHSTPIWHL
ncbi:MAG TPA: DNA repair protein RadC [Candidatus Anaerotruncus excrementipullorum]|uniref:DNA repair protein RadC n=1 Tax=Candidatus Anaerotruncus excrementipullorum TaxID=2838465 RepID=A0A9D1WSY5_9FIRM|nr:DNA repair protein RadC [Candidatus Anaerotruncus excrementipullorum]